MVSHLPHWRGWPLLAHAMKIEEYEDENRDTYVIRAELPGLDPAMDLSVMIADGEITIDVRRTEPMPGRPESEFHYGRQRRAVLLPRRARDETASATYDNEGILEIRVAMARPAPIGREVPIHLRSS
jgi:HSP20 family protein